MKVDANQDVNEYDRILSIDMYEMIWELIPLHELRSNNLNYSLSSLHFLLEVDLAAIDFLWALRLPVDPSER